MTTQDISEWPSVSVINPTYNGARTLGECLASIRNQDYPQDKIEILVVDGNSKDNTKTIAEKYGCRYTNSGDPFNPEPRRGIGLMAAKNELVAYIDQDNILPNKSWFKEMVQPFVENSEVVATQTWRYGLKPGFGLFNRYCALIGANDPVALYLGKSEKVSWLDDKWKVSPILEDHPGYILVRFNGDNLPTVGTNGFMARRKTLLLSRCDPENFFHIDVMADLVADGYDLMAMVKNEIYHDTAAKLSTLAYKRMMFFTEHSPFRANRRYLVFNAHKRKDVISVILFSLYTITLLQPLSLSIRGYLRKRDIAWFLHPLVCWSFLIAYSCSSIILYLRVMAYRISSKLAKK
ncbi:MAG: glycosyltransferase family 2 protein [Patescibacteria group bacterium]